MSRSVVSAGDRISEGGMNPVVAGRWILQVDLEVELAALVGGYATGDGAERGHQRGEDHQRRSSDLLQITPNPPTFARFAASTGKVGRMPLERRRSPPAVAPGTVCSVDRSCGSASATCRGEPGQARPASDLMSSPPRICASRNGPA